MMTIKKYTSLDIWPKTANQSTSIEDTIFII